MKGAEVLVQMLLEYKVEVIFGVPGDTILPLYEAICDAAPKIRHIMARDEWSAGFRPMLTPELPSNRASVNIQLEPARFTRSAGSPRPMPRPSR